VEVSDLAGEHFLCGLLMTGSQKQESRSWKPEARIQKLEARSKNPEAGSQKQESQVGGEIILGVFI
jgi:hypothetical protein